MKFNLRNLSKGKKLSILLMSVLLVGGGLAIWGFGHSATTGLVITSQIPITFSDDFNITNADTTSSSYSKTETITISNIDDWINMSVGIDENITDIIDSCNNSGDVTILTEYEGIEINVGEVIQVPNGNTELNVTISTKILSCPQTALVDVVLEQI